MAISGSLSFKQTKTNIAKDLQKFIKRSKDKEAMDCKSNLPVKVRRALTKRSANRDNDMDTDYYVPTKVQRRKRCIAKDVRKSAKTSQNGDDRACEFDVPTKARPLKRQKRDISTDLHEIIEPVEEDMKNNADELDVRKDDNSNEFDGPFRQNIRHFLAKYAIEMPLPPILLREGMAPYLRSWSTVLEFGHAEVTMHFVEENVRRSKSVHCENCRIAGQ